VLISAGLNPIVVKKVGVNRMKCATTETSRKFASEKRKTSQAQDWVWLSFALDWFSEIVISKTRQRKYHA